MPSDIAVQALSARSVRIVDRLPTAADLAQDDSVLIVCPWMRDLPAEAGPWLAALPIHDCNAVFEEDWLFAAALAERRRCYFGVFMLDRLRSSEGLLALLRQRGVDAIVNFPSVTFFDGMTATALGGLGFDAQAEMRALEKAAHADFRIGLCGRSEAVMSPLLPQAELRLLHEGPGRPFSCVAA